MSSWLAQSTELLLSQTPYLSDAKEPPVPTSSSKHVFTYSPESASSTPVHKVFSRAQAQQPSPSSKNAYSSCKIASSREKILQFGCSFSSQVTQQKSVSKGSPWNLFSQKSAVKQTKQLMQNLLMPSLSKQTSSQLEREPLPTRQATQQQELRCSSSSEVEHTGRESDTKLERETAFIACKEENKKQTELSPFFSKQEPGYAEDRKHGQQEQQQRKNKQKRYAEAVVPMLTPPTLGVFTLSYLLTKQGILSDFSAYSFYKENIEITQRELDLCHQQRIEKIKQSIEREALAKHWGSLAQLIEWFAPWIDIGIGAVVVASGGGIFAWCALFAGLITLTLNLIEYLDGWKQIAKRLPGKDMERKIRYINFVRYTLLAVTFLLSIASLSMEKVGFSALIEGAIRALPPALEGALAVLHGAMLWLRSRFEILRAHYSSIELKIDQLNWERDDYISRADDLLERLQASFESLSNTLQISKESDSIFVRGLS